MGVAEPPPGAGRPEQAGAGAGPGPVREDPGGLLEALGVAAMVLDADGRHVMWSPQAEELFGYGGDLTGSAPGALTGAPGEGAGGVSAAAARLREEAMAGIARRLFARVPPGKGGRAGVVPVRRGDGTTRPVEFRALRLRGPGGASLHLGLAADPGTVRRLEGDPARTSRLVTQSPTGFAVFDTDLRYLSVNPALEAMNGLPEADHLGRTTAQVLPDLDNQTLAAAMSEVLGNGEPLVDQHILGRTPADPEADHAYSVSLYRLDTPDGRVLGLAAGVLDITERYRARNEAAQVRQRLALVAEASQRLGTTLDLERTARELAELCVPALADVAAVDVLDSVLSASGPAGHDVPVPGEPAAFRALAVVGRPGSPEVSAAELPGVLAQYGPHRLITRCVSTGNAILVPNVAPGDLARIAPDRRAVELLADAGTHSYLAVPLIARGEVIGALDLKRAGNPLAFGRDDQTLAIELAARAAVCIDNARWYRNQRHAALTLQRHLLPHQPPARPGLEVAYRYEPAEAASQVGGDWFDAITLSGDRTALVVGDIMGSGIGAAATMGQVRTATRTLAELDLDPAELLCHLDHITADLERGFVTCVYAVHDPRTMRLRLATAGHLPPVLVRPGRPPVLLDLPTGAPLGVGGVAFEMVDVPVAAGDQLVMYTDGLVEIRDQPIDVGLRRLLSLLDDPDRSLQETCDLLLDTLRQGPDADDVVLLVARLVDLPG